MLFRVLMGVFFPWSQSYSVVLGCFKLDFMMGPIGSQVAVIISNALVMGISTDVDSESTAWDVTEVDPRQKKIPRDFSDFCRCLSWELDVQ